MSSNQTWEIKHDFFGTNDANGCAAEIQPFKIKDLSIAGSPTTGFVDGSNRGELLMQFDAQNEIQNLCLYQFDNLQFDIDKLTQVSFRVKLSAATMDATTQFAIGVTGDRNDAIDSIAQAALFRVIGADSTTLVVVETDDGLSANENNDVATNDTLINAYKTLTINFAAGTDDIRFFIDGEPVATSTTFDMSNYTGKLQLFAQVQKTANANTDGFTLDWIEIRGRDSSI